jgi:hypothetical protein
MAYVRFQSWMLNGHSGNISWRMKRVIVRGINHGLVTTSTRRDPRFPGDNSYHRLGRAVDMASTSRAKMVAFQRSELRRFRRWGAHKEIIGPDNQWIVLRGREVDLQDGSPLEDQHDNHVHIAQ